MASVEDLQQKLDDLQAEFTDFEATSKEVEGELEKEIDALSRENDKLTQRNELLITETEDLQRTNQSLSAQLNKAMAQMAELDGATAKLKARLRDLEEQNEKLERKQRYAQDSQERLEEQIESLTEDNILLKEELETMAAEADDTERNLRDVRLFALEVVMQCRRSCLRARESRKGTRGQVVPQPCRVRACRRTRICATRLPRCKLNSQRYVCALRQRPRPPFPSHCELMGVLGGSVLCRTAILLWSLTPAPASLSSRLWACARACAAVVAHKYL